MLSLEKLFCIPELAEHGPHARSIFIGILSKCVASKESSLALKDFLQIATCLDMSIEIFDAVGRTLNEELWMTIQAAAAGAYVPARSSKSISAASNQQAAKPKILGRPDLLEKLERFLQYSQELGELMIGLSRSTAHASMDFCSVARLAGLAIDLNQYKIYRNDAGSISGALVWAWITPKTVSCFNPRGLLNSHCSQWNEGELLCFTDMSAIGDGIAELAKDIAGAQFSEEARIFLQLKNVASKNIEIIEVSASERAGLAEWVRRQHRIQQETMQ